jgi:hypothetical protein
MNISDALKEQRDIEALDRQNEVQVVIVTGGTGDPVEVGGAHKALQGLTENDHPQYFHKTEDDSDNIPEGTNNKFLTAGQKGHLTGNGDGDQEHNHASKIDKDMSAVTEKTTPHDDDVLLINDSEDTGTLKKVKASNFGGSDPTTRWEPVTNGDAANPEIVFCDGDVVMAEVAI